MLRLIFLICLCVFLLATGIATATNIQVAFLSQAGGIAALVGGLLLIILIAVGDKSLP